ncbi:carboxymuconolactone decarboxylase [Polynucleobacter sp. SHI8]|uniref:carboxymuconolactone decarboxylase family protein n=1 Tax=unclassified Polynucleobacter TaxID=2640945 RepID=UPI00248F52D9|nr:MULTISPECIES: carboxymuconolactone decarboxylase family protein [unclassified Polynucleobacter]BDW10303.1 carboxymuconolactone decarboxylase [Polynucleobacter sp. SHI2]BDW12749.1 carboxymuconolactone decarboxylase [Polynucleobacter sp. SHI8]
MTKRIQEVEPGTRPELAEIEANILQERGRISPLYRTLLNSPEIAKGWEALLTAVRNRSSLPASLKELMILRVAVLNRANYEFDAHRPHAINAGVSEEQITLVQQEKITSGFTEVEILVMELTDVMTRDIQVPDALYDQVKVHFNDREILEVVTTISAYNMVSRLLNALHVGH